MTPATTFYMTPQQQIGSAAICLSLVIVVLYGLWTIWCDWQHTWSIDDLADDLLMGRDQHLVDERESMQARRAA